jgi:hypothetical protein
MRFHAAGLYHLNSLRRKGCQEFSEKGPPKRAGLLRKIRNSPENRRRIEYGNFGVACLPGPLSTPQAAI